VMRPLLLPGLLDAAAYNTAHGVPDLALFESAHVYRPSGPLDDGSGPGPPPAHERNHLAVLLTRGWPGSWRSEPRPADFYAANGVLDALLGSLRIAFAIEPGGRPFLDPGRSASVLVGDERKAGWIGELHPLVARAWDLEGAAAFEIDADLLTEEAPGAERYEDVTSFPAALQDIAVVVDEHVPLAEVEAAVRAGGGELLRAVSLFDVYRGEQVGPGRKSLALRLEFRAPDRTLTDDEVSGLRSGIEAQLAEIGGRLRA
jgi:phenylalanyl-tRNA synthetase beta chain